MQVPSGFNRLSVRAYSFLLAAALLMSLTLYLLIVESVKESTFALENEYTQALVRGIELDLESNGVWLKHYNESEKGRRIDQLRNMIDAARSIIKRQHENQEEYGHTTEEESKFHSLQLISNLIFNKNDYVWVIDTKGITLTHPNPKLVGRDVSDLKDPTGKFVIRPFLEQLKHQEEAINHYLFPRAGSDLPVEKVSYAKMYRPWGWIVGSGVYLDDVRQEVALAKTALEDRLRRQLQEVTFGSTGYGYIFSGEKRMIIHPDKKLEGVDLSRIPNPSSDKPLVDEMIEAYKRGERSYTYLWNHPNNPDNHRHEKIAWLGYAPSLDWYIATSIYPQEISDKADAIARRITLIAGLTILFLASLAAIAIQRGFAPLNRLAEIAREVSLGRYHHQIDIHRSDEIGLLAHTFNSMLAHIRQDIDKLTDKSDHLQEEKDAAEASEQAKDALLQQIERSRKELSHLANHDPLTGLPNRHLFQLRLEKAITKESQLALLFIDLDRFKNINDSLGHPVGDELLCAVTKRFQLRLRREDLLARLGGDEFIVLINHQISHEEAIAVATALIDCLKESFILSQNHGLFVGASIGISFYPDDGDEAHQLIKNADVAMYKAKERGRGRFHFYSRELTSDVSLRLNMETRLRNALDQNELTLVYQPQYDLAEERIIGVEALARWHDQELGEVSPAVFIPLAEECGLIARVGQWVVGEASQQLALWRENGIEGITMAFNLSAMELRQSDLVERTVSAVGSLDLSPDQFEIEITESALMQDVEKSLTTLESLAQLGFSLAVDDFGTGYSSLAYLKRLSIHKLKIDQGFIADIPQDKDDMKIAATIIAMARQLHLKVIAEGVETAEQEAFLKAHGCDEAQGFYFSRPLTAEALLALLRG
ncbi:MAG: EAL domain-containing protein [Candidatus Sedimenticola sp. (ex Thyasira tokunagai)]